MFKKVGRPPLSARTSLFVVICDLVGPEGGNPCPRCVMHHSHAGIVYAALH